MLHFFQLFIYIYIYILHTIYIYIYIYIYIIYIYIHTHIIYIYIYIYNLFIYIHTHIIYIYIYIYTHTHTHIQAEETGIVQNENNRLTLILLNKNSYYLLSVQMNAFQLILLEKSCSPTEWRHTCRYKFYYLSECIGFFWSILS